METIELDQIETAWRKIEGLTDDELGTLFVDFEEKQPEILDYLETAGSELLNTLERDELIFNGFTVYQMIAFNHRIPLIKKETIISVEERDFEQFKTGEDMVKAQDDLDEFIDNHNQRFLLEEFMDITLEDLENKTFRENTVSALFFILAALVGAIDESV